MLFGLLGSVSACDGCGGAKKPYTPFGVASALPSAEFAASPPPELGVPAPASSAGFAARKAVLVPNAPPTWQGSDLSLSAPEARRFAQVLPADFDGDDKLDAVAWLTPTAADKNAVPGELWYFPNGAPPRLLTPLPGFVPASPDCVLTVALTQTGAHSATLDVGARCSTLIARAPTRALVVVSPSVEHPILLTLRVAAAAPDETLNFSVDSSDQDHDGRDDVRLGASVGTAGASEPASADLLWLDRAAGSSRSASEPAASLLRSASKLAALARSKHSASTGERTNDVLRLMSSLCAEGGVPRVFDQEGAPFRCGDTSKVVDSLLLSEAVAALAQNDLFGAFSTLQRDGWYFSKLSSGQRKAIERELVRPVKKLAADAPFSAHTAPTVPALPHFSPLWFEADGALLIQGAGGVARVSADRGQEQNVSAEAGTPSWPLEVVGPSGQRVFGLVHACDRSELLLNQNDAQHPLLPPLPTRLIAARPASCTGHGTGPNVGFAPLGYDDDGLEALIAGARVRVTSAGKKAAATLPGLPLLGTPRSPDGRWLVAATPIGLLVVGEHKELWQTDKLSEHADASRLSDCVVADDARAVACIEAGRVLIFERPKPSVSATKDK